MTSRFRWWIALLLFSATAINYLDRLALPASESAIRVDIPISDAEYARLGAFFLAAYATMYVVGGRLMDWLGTRWGYAVTFTFWSAASMATGFATSVGGLAACRFLLGIGEGGSFPGAGKAVAEWFPAQERSFAFGIFNTGSALGSVLAVPLAVLIIELTNWRVVFFATGGIGLLWIFAWLAFYRRPEQSRFVSAEELQYIQQGRVGVGPTISDMPLRWSQLFSFHQLWALMTAKFLTDAAFYFYSFWIPKYLLSEHHLDLRALAAYGWIPYLFMAAGSFFGGWLGLKLIQRGLSLDLSRKLTLSIAAFTMPVSLLVSSAPLNLAIVFLGLALFGHQFWSSNVQTLAADLFPSNVVGSVEGLVGAAGATGGMVFQFIAAWLVTNYGYAPAFALAAVLYPLALMIIIVGVGRIRPVDLREFDWRMKPNQEIRDRNANC